MLLLVYLLLIPLSMAHAGKDNGFAVVELFASEGCSSCPPADRVLSTLVKDAKATGARIYPLSFQVDYWNYLGWIDPYSSAEFTKRQYAYAHRWGKNSAYTPQIIVNGSHEFIGSDAKKARKIIDQALHESTDILFNIGLEIEQEHIKVDYHINSFVTNAVINIAWVEDNLVSHVSSGENRGEVLMHDHVVRSFQSFAIRGLKGAMTIKKPNGVNLKNSAIIAFIQDIKTYKILAAKAKDFTERIR